MMGRLDAFAAIGLPPLRLDSTAALEVLVGSRNAIEFLPFERPLVQAGFYGMTQAEGERSRSFAASSRQVSRRATVPKTGRHLT